MGIELWQEEKLRLVKGQCCGLLQVLQRYWNQAGEVRQSRNTNICSSIVPY